MVAGGCCEEVITVLIVVVARIEVLVLVPIVAIAIVFIVEIAKVTVGIGKGIGVHHLVIWGFGSYGADDSWTCRGSISLIIWSGSPKTSILFMVSIVSRVYMGNRGF